MAFSPAWPDPLRSQRCSTALLTSGHCHAHFLPGLAVLHAECGGDPMQVVHNGPHEQACCRSWRFMQSSVWHSLCLGKRRLVEVNAIVSTRSCVCWASARARWIGTWAWASSSDQECRIAELPWSAEVKPLLASLSLVTRSTTWCTLLTCTARAVTLVTTPAASTACQLAVMLKTCHTQS